MKMNIIAIADALPGRELLARLAAAAGREREDVVQLVAHLAALDKQPAFYAAEGYGSLFSYCTQALLLSEDAACARIEAARACRRFPAILDLLASGDVTLTSVRLLSRHLTPENHLAVLARAKRRSRQQIEALVAELAPQPDVPNSVRKLPAFAPAPAAAVPAMPRQSPEPTSAPGASASAGAAAPGDPRRRSGRHLRPCRHAAPGKGREDQARGGEAATTYPSQDG